MAKIQHADLPDIYLHEPKGTRTAQNGMVYVANGDTTGGFKFLPLTSLSFTIYDIQQLSITSIPSTLTLNGTGLLQTANGVISDVNYVTQVPTATVDEINKNFKELYVVYQREKEIHDTVKTDVEALTSKLNTLIEKLADLGLITDE